MTTVRAAQTVLDQPTELTILTETDTVLGSLDPLHSLGGPELHRLRRDLQANHPRSRRQGLDLLLQLLGVGLRLLRRGVGARHQAPERAIGAGKRTGSGGVAALAGLALAFGQDLVRGLQILRRPSEHADAEERNHLRVLERFGSCRRGATL